MLEEQFLELCTEKSYQEIEQFQAALAFAKKALQDKKRLAGDTFFEHNVRVARTLAVNHTAAELVMAGILHGLPLESEQEIKKQFGEEIFSLVQGLKEIRRIKSKNVQLEAEAFRKLILTTLTDVRVIFVKLAGKLDNLTTISYLPKEEQTRIAEETLEVYAPLASRLGVEKIKVKLEDLAFKIVYPKKYQEIVNFVEASQEQREKDVEEAITAIKKVCENNVDLIRIKGRPKHFYSIYKKLVERKIKLEEQYDLLGIRIITQDVKDCYAVLGLLHETFQPLEGTLKDYVANPKPNFYRSIHTAVELPDKKIVEIQIRTEEMDEFAEEGLAAHWRYKGVKSDHSFEKKTAWLRNILELQKEAEHKEFLETAKVDVFGDKIYCYTPKGDVKELPKEATLLDFAFLVHEEVGSHAVGGRVNGKFVSLKHKLVLGDVVEVVTNKNQRPRRGWLKIIKSGRARQKIRKSLKRFETLPAFHYRTLPVIKEEQGVLAESEAFPQAICTLAKCCQAIPGNEIVGIVTKKRIVSVHRNDCRQALKEQERWVPVNWKNKFNQKIQFFVHANERSGILADLLHTIATAGFEVKEAKAKLIDLGHAECSFLVIPRNLEYLLRLIKRVQKVKSVKRVYFE